jgi:hypothetical protein
MKTTRKQNLLAAALVASFTLAAAPVLAQDGTNVVAMPGSTNTDPAQGVTNAVVAQDGTNALEVIERHEPSERPPYRPWTIGIEAGTEGIYGGSASWRFSDHVGVGTAVDYGQATWNHLGIAGIQYDAKLRLMAEPLVLNLYPWKKHSFHFGLGLMFNQNQLTGTASDTGLVTIDGHPLPIIAGQLSMKIHQQLVNPYFGLGGNFFYFDCAHHWAAGGELGVAYTGTAEAHINRGGASSPVIDTAVQAAEYELERYANQYKWWPVAKLNVNFSF